MNRLKSAFASNAVLKEHDVAHQICSAGPGLLWKVYSATYRVHKRPVSVWMFDKKALAADKNLSKHQREKIISILKQGATKLLKLKHPAVLAVTMPLTETKDLLAFATEPVFASLSNVLGKTDNIERVSIELREFELLDIEITMGLIELSKALDFLTTADLIHNNLCPNSVMLNHNGEWRLAGFDFGVHVKYQTDDTKYEYPEKNIVSSIDRACLPDLNYRAPEFIMNGSGDTKSDMYALANVIYACYNNGQPPCECNGNILDYKQQIETISRMTAGQLQNVPETLRDLTKLMLNAHGGVRPTPTDFSAAPCFDGLEISCLRYLATIYEKTEQNKATFMKGLSQHVKTFPKRVVLKKVLPVLLAEAKTPLMVPFVLPNILLIAEMCSIVEFETLIFESMVPLFEVEDPPQVLSIFLHKFELLLTKSPVAKVPQLVFPMLYRAIDGEDTALHGVALQVLPTFQKDIDYALLKKEIIPRIIQLCTKTPSPSIKIASLVCIGKLMPSFDKWFMQETVWPFVLSVKGIEPGLVMSVCGIIDMGLKDPKYGVDATTAARKLLPFVSPMVCFATLNATQIEKIFTVIKGLVNIMEKERVAKLKESEKMNAEASDSVSIARGTGTRVTESTMSGLLQSSKKNTFDVGAASRAAEEADRVAKEEQERKEIEKTSNMFAAKPETANDPFRPPQGLTGVTSSLSNGLGQSIQASTGTAPNAMSNAFNHASQSTTGPTSGMFGQPQTSDSLFNRTPNSNGATSSVFDQSISGAGAGVGAGASSSVFNQPQSSSGSVFDLSTTAGNTFNQPAQVSSTSVFGSSGLSGGGLSGTPNSSTGQSNFGGSGLFGSPQPSAGGGGNLDPFASMSLGSSSMPSSSTFSNMGQSTSTQSSTSNGLFAGIGQKPPQPQQPNLLAAQDLLGGLLMPSNSSTTPFPSSNTDSLI